MVARDALGTILTHLAALESDHRRIASSAQAAKSRAASVEVTLRKVQSLSAKQSALMREAAEAASFALYRSAHVAAFAALADALHTRIDRKGTLAQIAGIWGWKLTTAEDLQEHADYQVAEAAKASGTISKTQMKTFHGLLHTRNQCAHPTGYDPDLDQTLGYLSSVLKELDAYSK